SSSNAFDRGMGSIAFAAIARSVFLVGAHPEENDPRKIITPVKGNLTEKVPSRIFSIQQAVGEEHPEIVWGEETLYSANDILKTGLTGLDENNKLEEAIVLLQNQLKSGEKSARMVFELAKKQGINDKTLKRAKKELGIESWQTTSGWLWKLPSFTQKPDDNKEWPF